MKIPYKCSQDTLSRPSVLKQRHISFRIKNCLRMMNPAPCGLITYVNICIDTYTCIYSLSSMDMNTYNPGSIRQFPRLLAPIRHACPISPRQFIYLIEHPDCKFSWTHPHSCHVYIYIYSKSYIADFSVTCCIIVEEVCAIAIKAY